MVVLKYLLVTILALMSLVLVEAKHGSGRGASGRAPKRSKRLVDSNSAQFGDVPIESFGNGAKRLDKLEQLSVAKWSLGEMQSLVKTKGVSFDFQNVTNFQEVFIQGTFYKFSVSFTENSKVTFLFMLF
jgi:hypothetical protein